MDGELLSLKWNNHRTTFYHVISGLRNKVHVIISVFGVVHVILVFLFECRFPKGGDY